MGDATRNFVSQWTQQEARDVSNDKGDDPETQWRSVQRVSIRCQPTPRDDDDVESIYANDAAPQWLSWTCSADRSFRRRIDTTTAAATAAQEDNTEHEHREQVSNSSLPVKIRPQSASTSRARASRDVAAKLDLEVDFTAPRAAKSRSRPQSAKLSRSHLGSSAVRNQPPSPSVLLSQVIPQQMKDSKWTEMMFRSPEFQQTNLIRLEHETYELLQSVFRKESRAVQESNAAGLVKQKAKKNKNKQNAVAMKSTKASEAKQKTRKKAEEYYSTFKSVPCGSGMQLARDRKQSELNGSTQSKEKHPTRTKSQQRDEYALSSLNQTEYGDPLQTAFTPRQLARKTTNRKELTRKSEAKERPRREDSSQSRDEDDAVRNRVLLEMGWPQGEKDVVHDDKVKARKHTRGRLKRGTQTKQKLNNSCAVAYPEQDLLATASEQSSSNSTSPLQHPLCTLHEPSKAPPVVAEDDFQQLATDAVESSNVSTEAELEPLWISIPNECLDRLSRPLPNGSSVDEELQCAASAPAIDCEIANDEDEDWEERRRALLYEDELARQQLLSDLDASPAANQFTRQGFALDQDTGPTGDGDKVGVSLATLDHLEHGTLLHSDDVSDSPVRAATGASLQPPLEELLPVAAASPPSHPPETARERDSSYLIEESGAEIDAQDSAIAGVGERDGWSCLSPTKNPEASQGFDPSLLDIELSVCESVASPGREDTPTQLQLAGSEHRIDDIETDRSELRRTCDAKDAEDLRPTQEPAHRLVDEDQRDGNEHLRGCNNEPIEAIESVGGFGGSIDPNTMDLLSPEVATEDLLALTHSPAACDAANEARSLDCETAAPSRFQLSKDVGVQLNSSDHSIVLRSIERGDKASIINAAAERVSDCGDEEAIVRAIVRSESREEALDLVSDHFEHIGLHGFDTDHSKAASQTKLQSAVLRDRVDGTLCQGASEQDRDDSAAHSIYVVVADRESGSATLNPLGDPDLITQTLQSPPRGTDTDGRILGAQATTPSSLNKDIRKEEVLSLAASPLDAEDCAAEPVEVHDTFLAGKVESQVAPASENRSPTGDCEDKTSPTLATCSDEHPAAVASVFADEECARRDADIRDGTPKPPEESCLSGNDEAIYLVIHGGATLSKCASSLDEKKSGDTVDQPPHSDPVLSRAGDSLPCTEPKSVNFSSCDEASAVTVSSDTGYSEAAVVMVSEPLEAQVDAAARRIQRQYRCFVQRQIITDQLKFLVSQHHRQMRKKTRRASTELKIALTLTTSSDSRPTPSLSAGSSLASLGIEKPLAQVLDAASDLTAVVEALERQVELEEPRAQGIDKPVCRELSAEGNLYEEEEPTGPQRHLVTNDKVEITANSSGLEDPSTTAAAVVDDGLGVTVYETSSEMLPENVDSSWANAVSLQEEDRGAQVEEEEPQELVEAWEEQHICGEWTDEHTAVPSVLDPELSSVSRAAEERELGDTHKLPPAVRSGAADPQPAAHTRPPKGNERAAEMAETGVFRSKNEHVSDDLIAEPPLAASQLEDQGISPDNDAYLRSHAASIALAALAFDDDEETTEPEMRSSQDLSPGLATSSFYPVTTAMWEEEAEPLNEHAKEQLLNEPSAADHWERYLDAVTNKSYYFNPSSQVSQWMLPEHCEVIDKVGAFGGSVAMVDLNSPSSVAESGDAIQQQEAWHQVRVESLLLESFGGWSKYLMNESAVIFFHHQERDEYFHSTDGFIPNEFSEAQVQFLYEQHLSPVVSSSEGDEVSMSSSEWTGGEDTAHGHGSNLSTNTSDERWSLRRNVSQSAEKRGAWQAFVDAESGLPFYYNAHTGESTWDPPAVFQCELSAPPYEWAMYMDDASGAAYYVNVVTGETSWDKPTDFDKATTEHKLGIQDVTHDDGEAGRVDHRRGDHERVEDDEEEEDEYVIRIDEEHSAELLDTLF